MIIAVPICLLCALYLSEYAGPRLRGLMKPLLDILAAIPSVIYGVWGLLAIVPFVQHTAAPALNQVLGFIPLFYSDNPTGYSVLAAALVLSVMVIPVIVAVTYEVLQTVPQGLREASLAVGATRWQTIRTIVLPNSLGGILTGVILEICRAAGETAPILFTGAAFFLPHLPKSPLDATMALPYHLFVISTQVPEMPIQIQYGTALVLIIFVLGMNLVASVIRSRARAKRQW